MILRKDDLPSEPKDTAGKRNATNHHVRQSPLGNGNAVVGLELAVVPRNLENDGEGRNKLTDDQAKEGETGLTQVEAMDTDENQGVCGKEKVEQPINEAHVNGEKQDDGLREEESQGTGEILADELAKVDFDFLLFGVNAPVLGATSQFRSLANENDWWVRFGEEEQV